MVENNKHDDLRELAAKATPGPWKWKTTLGRGEMPVLVGADGKVCDFGEDMEYYSTEGGPPSDEDAAYIAAANPTRVTALLDELRDAQRENERLREAIERIDFTLSHPLYSTTDVLQSVGNIVTMALVRERRFSADNTTPATAPFEGTPVGELTPITLGVEQAPTFTYAEIAAPAGSGGGLSSVLGGAMITYRTVSLVDVPADVRERDDYAEVYDEEYRLAVVRVNGDAIEEILRIDGGEPEDNSFGRDGAWIAPALNAAYKLGRESR